MNFEDYKIAADKTSSKDSMKFDHVSREDVFSALDHFEYLAMRIDDMKKSMAYGKLMPLRERGFTIDNVDFDDEEMHALTGMIGEVGEIATELQTEWLTGVSDDPKLKAEIGDFFWYLAKLMKKRGWTLEEILEGNIAKLSARYANKGFDATRAINKDPAAEKAALNLVAGKSVL